MNGSRIKFIPFLAADNGLIIPAGQPAKLNFAIPHHVDITKPSYRGTRFYKNEKLLGIIHKADKTPNCTCTEEGICQRLNLQLNTTQANVEISKTQIIDGGSYSIEVIFTDVNSNFRSSQTLEVIKGKKRTQRHNHLACKLVPLHYATSRLRQKERLSTHSRLLFIYL